MDDEEDRQDLPLIAYPSEQREVILRSGPSVVLFDHRSRQISLVSVEEDDSSSGVCPTCQRPFDDHDETPWSPAPFISPDYFRLLDRSHEASVRSSRSPSPTRLLRSEASSSRVFTPQHPTVEEDDVLENSTEVPLIPRPPNRAGWGSSHISSDSFSPGYFAQHFIEVKELGRGGFGVVLLVKHIIQNHEIGAFALKRIPVGDDSSWLAKILQEVQLLQTLNHRNLVGYKHVWLEEYSPSAFAPSVPHAFILQQYCNRGDLQSYMAAGQDTTESEPQDARGRRQSWSRPTRPIMEARSIPPEQVFSFFKDIASGLGNLHQHGFIHRDLKPSNCLLHDSGGRLTCLVSDFGETVGENFARKSSGATGTVSWCAPEVLRADPVSGAYGEFSQKSDIFSLGLILHLMCFGRLPYSNSNPFDETTEDIDKVREEIASWAGLREDALRSNLPGVLFASLKRLLSLTPSERPDADEILRELKQFSLKSNERSASFSEREKRFRAASGQDSEPAERSTSSRRNSPLSDHAMGQPASQSSFQSNRQAASLSPPVPVPSTGSAQEFELATPTDASLIRRRRLPQQNEPLRLPSPKGPLQLLAPPKPSTAQLLSRISKSPITRIVIKVCIFAVKAWTLFTPCQPLAMRLDVAYPLLCMAAIDLLGSVDAFWTSMALATGHAFVLTVVGRFDTLCSEGYPADAVL